MRYRLETFIQNTKGTLGTSEPLGTGIGLAGLNSGFTSTPGDFTDVDAMIIEDASKKITGADDSKIDKYLTDNMYYNAEHHQGKSNIIEWEKPARIVARSEQMERMGDTVPMFIRDLVTYATFAKEPSFLNLSQLLKEIFDMSQIMATKAYSHQLDSLSQDQILKETSDFLLNLFDEYIQTHLNLRDVVNVDDLIRKVANHNLDTEKNDQFLLSGLSLFLFMMLSKLYSENMNYYQVMEKLMALLLDRIPTLYLELLVFLVIIEKEDALDMSKKLQGIFQGMYFDKVCDLLNRCCNHVENFREIMSSTLKFAYVNLPSDVMLEIVKVLMLAVVKSKGDYFKQVIIFTMRVFNPKIAFDMELSQTFKNLSNAYRSNLRVLIHEATKPTAGTMQGSFWAVHKIITQE